MAKNDIIEEKNRIDRRLQLYPFYAKFNLMKRPTWEKLFKTSEDQAVVDIQKFENQTQKKILELESVKTSITQNKWKKNWLPKIEAGLSYSRYFGGNEQVNTNSELVGRLGLIFSFDDLFWQESKLDKSNFELNRIREHGSGGLKRDQSWRKVSPMVQSILSAFVGPVSFKI